MHKALVVARLYRRILRFMPVANRDLYAEEMAAVLTRMIETERPAGRPARIRWDIVILLRALVAITGMHVDRWRRDRREAAASFLRPRGLGADVRYVLRALRAAPWYALTVIGVVAVPTTMAATTFAIVDGVLFRPLPYPNAGELIALLPNFDERYRSANPDLVHGASEIDLRHWRAAVPGISLTAWRAQPWGGLGPNVNDDTAGVALVESNFFDVIGVRPIVGGFTADDFATQTPMRPVIALYHVWTGRFSGESILGREIISDPATGSGVRIVGIMPRGFTFPSARADVSFIAPYVSNRVNSTKPEVRLLSEIVARLPDGVSREQLAERLRPALAAVAREFPPRGAKPQNWSDAAWHRQGPYDVVETLPLPAALSRRYGGFFKAVFGAVALLVVMAAVNISSLMSARAFDRRPEMDVRRSLGAGRSVVARLWVLESLTLVLTGGLLAALATPSLLKIMLRLLPDSIALLKPAMLDWRVIAFVGGALLLLALITAIAPVRGSIRPASTRGATSRVRTRGRFLIVSAQVSVAVVLTVLGSMLVGSLLLVYAERPDVDSKRVATVDVRFSGPGATMSVSPERTAREQALRAELLRVPGVTAAGTSAAQVLRGGGAMTWFDPPAGRTLPRNVDTWAVTEGFYDVLQPELVAGRLPTDSELRTAAPVVVLSESVARHYWPDTSALGQSLTDSQTKAAFSVIGVVRDIRWTALDIDSPVIYAPYRTTSRAPWITVFLRTDGQTGRVLAEALNAITRTDALARPMRTGTLDELFRESVSLRRFQSWLFGSFAAAALVIVGGGILGLLAMTTARRTREVGIRCALGATPQGVVRLILREQLVAVVIGVAVGAAGAALAVQPLTSYLYRVTAADPAVWGVAIGLVVLTAALGSILPAVRASRVDPLQALRQE